jgi:hypothetical protein
LARVLRPKEETSLLARVLRLLLNALHGVVSVLSWLARQTYRQRALGVAANPDQTRLLDLHFVTVAAHLALLAALVVARPAPTGRDWLLSLPLLALMTTTGVWRAGRARLAVLVTFQLAILLTAALISREPIMLTILVAVAVAQQASLVTAWARTAKGSGLGRATAAGLLLGVFTGGGGLIGGVFAPTFPLWVATVLMGAAAVIAFRIPRQERPALPKQQDGRLPEGYTIYRPSSLDDRS